MARPVGPDRGAGRGDDARPVLHLGLRRRHAKPVPGGQVGRHRGGDPRDRVSLGVGIGWWKEEFELLGADFHTRGRRTDEALALMKALWEPGWTEFDGEFYSAPRMQMNPSPAAPVPILVGGLSEVAFARAARHDGWVGDIYSLEEACRHARRLGEIRAAAGADGPFEIITALSDAFLPEHFATAAAAGITDVWTMPWAYYSGVDASLEQKLDGMRRFAEDVMAPTRSTVHDAPCA